MNIELLIELLTGAFPSLFLAAAVLNLNNRFCFIALIAALVAYTNTLPWLPTAATYLMFATIYTISGLIALSSKTRKGIYYAILMCVACFLCGSAASIVDKGNVLAFWDQYEYVTIYITITELAVLIGLSRHVLAGITSNVVLFLHGLYDRFKYIHGYQERS